MAVWHASCGPRTALLATLLPRGSSHRCRIHCSTSSPLPRLHLLGGLGHVLSTHVRSTHERSTHLINCHGLTTNMLIPRGLAALLLDSHVLVGCGLLPTALLIFLCFAVLSGNGFRSFLRSANLLLAAQRLLLPML